MNKYYILVWEEAFIRIFETSSKSIYDIDINALMAMCNNGIIIENGYIENGNFKLHGNIKKYKLDNNIERFVTLSKIGDSNYEVVNQYGKTKLLTKNDLTVSNSLNVKVVAYKTSEGIFDTKIVPYSGTLETKSYSNIQQVHNVSNCYNNETPNTSDSEESNLEDRNKHESSAHPNKDLKNVKGIKGLMGVFKR